MNPTCAATLTIAGTDVQCIRRVHTTRTAADGTTELVCRAHGPEHRTMLAAGRLERGPDQDSLSLSIAEGDAHESTLVYGIGLDIGDELLVLDHTLALHAADADRG